MAAAGTGWEDEEGEAPDAAAVAAVAVAAGCCLEVGAAAAGADCSAGADGGGSTIVVWMKGSAELTGEVEVRGRKRGDHGSVTSVDWRDRVRWLGLGLFVRPNNESGRKESDYSVVF